MDNIDPYHRGLLPHLGSRKPLKHHLLKLSVARPQHVRTVKREQTSTFQHPCGDTRIAPITSGWRSCRQAKECEEIRKGKKEERKGKGCIEVMLDGDRRVYAREPIWISYLKTTTCRAVVVVIPPIDPLNNV